MLVSFALLGELGGDGASTGRMSIDNSEESKRPAGEAGNGFGAAERAAAPEGYGAAQGHGQGGAVSDAENGRSLIWTSRQPCGLQAMKTQDVYSEKVRPIR